MINIIRFWFAFPFIIISFMIMAMAALIIGQGFSFEWLNEDKP